MEDKRIGFLLNKIETTQFSTVENVYNPQKRINLKFALNFICDNGNHTITVLFKVFFVQESATFITIEVGCQFVIEKEKWDEIEKGNKKLIIFPKNFMAHLSMLTIGTCRGVLHSKLEKTEFNKLILPTINIAEKINEDVRFEFAEEKSDDKS